MLKTLTTIRGFLRSHDPIPALHLPPSYPWLLIGALIFSHRSYDLTPAFHVICTTTYFLYDGIQALIT
jgi:hypothetical protein